MKMNIEHVTVLADRDEAAADGKAPSYRGEEAARRLGAKLSYRIEFAIALPGESGTKADVLTEFEAGGVDAVRALLSKAVPFKMTAEERERFESETRDSLALERAGRDYPLPRAIGAKLMHHIHDGQAIIAVEVEPDGRKKGEAPIIVPASSLYSIESIVTYADDENALGLRIALEDMAGRKRYVDAPREMLARNRGSDIKAELYKNGLQTFSSLGEGLVLDVLKGFRTNRTLTVVSRPGWHRPDGEPRFFAAPGGQVLADTDDITIELAKGSGLPRADSGSLAGQVAAIDEALRQPDVPHWHLGAAGGGMGVIIDLLGEDSCGLDMSGLSSLGKTFAQRLAASWWGSIKVGEGIMKTLRTTDNALEQTAQMASGTALILDEVAHADPKELGRLIYMLAGNTGKQRADKSARHRASYRWNTGILLSSETGLKVKVEAGGGTWVAGMSVRIVDVKVSGTNAKVKAATMESIERGLRENFGHIGPQFVQRIIDDGLHLQADALRSEVSRLAKHIATDFGEKGEAEDVAGIDRRAARPLAILWMAGDMAKGCGLLPDSLDMATAIKWAWESFQASDEAGALKPQERALSNLREWIASRWNITIKPTEPSLNSYGEVRMNNREAVGWYDSEFVFVPKSTLVRAAGDILTEADVVRALEAVDGIGKKHRGRAYVRRVPKVGLMDAYALSRQSFGIDTNETGIEELRPVDKESVMSMMDLIKAIGAEKAGGDEKACQSVPPVARKMARNLSNENNALQANVPDVPMCHQKTPTPYEIDTTGVSDYENSPITNPSQIQNQDILAQKAQASIPYEEAEKSAKNGTSGTNDDNFLKNNNNKACHFGKTTGTLGTLFAKMVMIFRTSSHRR